MLTASEFKQQVRLEARLKDAKAPLDAKVPLDVVDAIADLFASQDQTTRGQIGLVLDLARYESAQVRTAQKKETRAALADLVLGLTTPEAMLSCRQREEAVRPYAEQLRRDYFGAATVPFPSYEKAVAWLRQQAVVERRPNPKQMLRLVTDMDKTMQRFPKDMDLAYSMTNHEFPLLARLNGSVGFNKGSALEKLKQATKDMSAGTGCSEALCVAHVLAGAPLILSPLRWRHEVSIGCGLTRRSARIDILQPHAVTLPVLAQGFRLLRETLGLAKKKTLTERHERLLRLVEKRGGVPKRGGKTEFWEDVQRAWNKAVPKGEYPYVTWRGPLMAYRRIQKALKKR
jgi:hypothetical protein